MFHGSMVALVTPMQADGAVDYAALEKLLEFHVANKTDAIVSVGTTGESATLSTEEHCDVVKFTVNKIRGRVPVIAGTGSNSTREAIDLTEYAKEAGADACLLVAPYYNKPTQEGIFLHYKAIADAVAIPQIIYNVPGRTVVDILPPTVGRLAGIPNIVGIKEATGNLQRAREILERCGDQLDLYSGDDATALDLILLGAKGDISVTANVAPRAMHDMCQLALAGKAQEATAINEKLMSLHKNLFLEANPIPVKWALHEMGMIDVGIRLPLTPLSQQHRSTIRSALRDAGVL